MKKPNLTLDEWKYQHYRVHSYDKFCPYCQSQDESGDDDTNDDEINHEPDSVHYLDPKTAQIVTRSGFKKHNAYHIDAYGNELLYDGNCNFCIDLRYQRVLHSGKTPKKSENDHNWIEKPIDWDLEHQGHYHYADHPHCPHCKARIGQAQAVAKNRERMLKDTEPQERAFARFRNYLTYRVFLRDGKYIDISVESEKSRKPDGVDDEIKLRLGSMDRVSYFIHLSEHDLEVERQRKEYFSHKEREWYDQHLKLVNETIRWFENQRQCELMDRYRHVIKNLGDAFRTIYEYETYVFEPLVRKSNINWRPFGIKDGDVVSGLVKNDNSSKDQDED